jgi:hypothetical protein
VKPCRLKLLPEEHFLKLDPLLLLLLLLLMLTPDRSAVSCPGLWAAAANQCSCVSLSPNPAALSKSVMYIGTPPPLPLPPPLLLLLLLLRGVPACQPSTVSSSSTSCRNPVLLYSWSRIADSAPGFSLSNFCKTLPKTLEINSATPLRSSTWFLASPPAGNPPARAAASSTARSWNVAPLLLHLCSPAQSHSAARHTPLQQLHR